MNLYDVNAGSICKVLVLNKFLFLQYDYITFTLIFLLQEECNFLFQKFVLTSFFLGLVLKFHHPK